MESKKTLLINRLSIAWRHGKTSTTTLLPTEQLETPDERIGELADEEVDDKIVYEDETDGKILYRVR